MKWRIAFDDVRAKAIERFGEKAAELTYGVTFEADSREDAEAFAREAMADVKNPVGKWHLEPAE